MRTIKVYLVDGFDWHGEKVGTLDIRAPNGQLHAMYGEPRILVYNPDGAGYYVDQPAVIRQYTEALVKHEGGADILPLLTLADSMLIRGAIIDFFTAAAAAVALKKRTSSSSAPAS